MSRADETDNVEKNFMIVLLAITFLLMAAGFYFFCKYARRGHTRPRAHLDTHDRSKVPSVQSPFGNVGPWRDVFCDGDDEGVLSLKSEADESTVIAGYGGRTRQQSEHEYEESSHEVDRRCSSSVFSDGPASATSSVTMDADDLECDSIMRFPPEQLKAPSFGSSQDDSLHLFNDSNDGSVHII